MKHLWIFLLFFLLATAPEAGRTQDAADPQAAGRCESPVQPLRIGVRSAARPFSYRPDSGARTDATSGPLNARGYTGYMVRICDAVLEQMMLDGDLCRAGDIDIVDVDESARPDGPDRLDRLGAEFDILCDPATITNSRRRDHIVSPPLFLTGVSILAPIGLFPENICGLLRARKDLALIGVVGGTTAGQQGVEALIRSGIVAEVNDELNNYLAGRPICDGAVDPDQMVRAFPTHPDAAAAFCGAPLAQMRVLYYLGDLEIITANAGAVPGCRFDPPTQTYTNDRYAIFGTADWQNQRDRAQRIARFFEILAQKVVFSPSLLDQAFKDTFIGQTPSRKLELFFWSIRGEIR